MILTDSRTELVSKMDTAEAVADQRRKQRAALVAGSVAGVVAATERGTLVGAESIWLMFPELAALAGAEHFGRREGHLVGQLE